jgi:hypothetical protein
MRLDRPLLLACCAAALACSTAGVELRDVRGAYSTHFDGIPDEGRVCAVIHNGRDVPIEWVRLRLVSRSSLGERPGRWRSDWLFRGHIEPGESVAVELERPPMADQGSLRMQRAGRGQVRERGRPVRVVQECSADALSTRLRGATVGRQAKEREIHAIAFP